MPVVRVDIDQREWTVGSEGEVKNAEQHNKFTDYKVSILSEIINSLIFKRI